MISAQLIADIQSLATAVTASAPLKLLPRLQLTILQAKANAVVAEVDSALAGAAGQLDAGDPTGFAGDLVEDLLALAEAGSDQEKLCNARGYVGRATFNINQVLP